MDHSKPIQTRPLTPTDTLINGLIGGILAGLGMLAWLLLAGLLAGDAPATVLARFLIPGQPPNVLTSIFIHLGVSAVYGGIFGLLQGRLPAAGQSRTGKIIAGLAYGLLLYLLASGIILPGTGSPLTEIPATTLITAHLVYGALLAGLVSGKSRS